MDDDWRLRAACRDVPLDVFFVPRGERPDEAREICAGCPVRDRCLEEALQLPEEGDCGVWGGTTRSQRKQLLRRHGGRQQHAA